MVNIKRKKLAPSLGQQWKFWNLGAINLYCKLNYVFSKYVYCIMTKQPNILSEAR